MKRTLIIVAIFILSFVMILPVSARAFEMSSFSGPRVTDLYLIIVRDPDAQLLALEKGQVHILSDIARPVDIERLSQNPSIDMSLAKGFHGFFLGFNLRAFPWNSVALRQAACEAIPREKLVRDLFSGYAEPLSTFLPPASPYFEQNVVTYPYNPDHAKKRLQEAGWSWNKNGILVSPDGIGPDAKRTLTPQKLLSPTAQIAPTTAEIAEQAAASLRAIGIPIAVEPMDFSTMIALLDERKFDTYVLAWQMTRDPDSLFALYHSSMDVKGGYNIPGICNSNLDSILERLRWAHDEASARLAASEAQKMLADIVPVVPIYSRYSISATSTLWKGTYATSYTTSDNIWSFLRMEPREGSMEPLRVALADEPRSLNPLTASSAYDWNVLSLIYDALLAINPENLGDLPWIAESWKIETIKEGGLPATKLSFHIRKGVTWQDGRPLTASDPAFTISFLKKHRPPRFYDAVSDVDKVETPDEYTLEVTMKTTSYWHLHNIGGLPIFPRHILEKVSDWQSWKPAQIPLEGEEGLSQLVGSGPFIFKEYRPGEYVHFIRNPHFWLFRK